MNQSRPFSEHRQKRWELWASLWLARVVRLLSVFASIPMPEAWRAWFDCVLKLLTKAVVGLVLIRAAQLLPTRDRIRNPRQVALAMRRHDVRMIDRGGMREAIGGKLRRAVKSGDIQAKDFRARAEKLIRVLKALDLWAALIARRMRNGMTRLLNLHTRATETLPLHRPAGGPPRQIAFGEEFRAALAPP